MMQSKFHRAFRVRRAILALSTCSALVACSAGADGSSDPATESYPASGEATTGTGDDTGTRDDAGSSDVQEPSETPDADGTGTDTDSASPDPSSGTDAGSTTTPKPPAVDPYAIPAGKVPYRGINLAGAEFGNAIPGKEGSDYNFPTPAMVDYYMQKGMNTFRVGFKWERLQPTANGEFDATYGGKLEALVNYAASKGAHVILNPHNFARYYGNTVGSTQVPNAVFADLWKRLATRFADKPNVMFNLVNEPHDMPTMQWVGAANAAIAAIRATGARNTIVAPGNNWTGAHSWFSTEGGTSNAVGMLQLKDPIDNTLIEVHQYLDASSGGGSGACVSTTIGSERLAAWVKWLRDNKKKGFIGEFAGRNDATCSAAIKDMMTYMHTNSDVVEGWLWWAGGPGWGDYVFTLEPKNGQDRPQMAWLTPFLAAPK